MIDNGGFVFAVQSQAFTGIMYAQWVPLVAPAITVSESGTLALIEGGTAVTYDVRLAVAPTGILETPRTVAPATVVVRVASDDGGTVSVNKAGGTAAAQQDLTFTTATWNTAQTVTLAAVADGDTNGERVTITHAVRDAASADEYDDAADVTLTVTIAEPGITVTPASALALTEGGSAGTYAVLPTGGVRVRVASDNSDVTVQAAGAGMAGASADLDFTTGNWNTAQAATVAAGGGGGGGG